MKRVSFDREEDFPFIDGEFTIARVPDTTARLWWIKLTDDAGKSVRELIDQSNLNEIVTALLDEGAFDLRSDRGE